MSKINLDHLFEDPEHDEYQKYNKWHKPRAKINLMLSGSCDQCGRRLGQDLYCWECCSEES